MVTKIIACSDIHIPSLKGIDELKETLTVFIEKCKKIVKDEDGPENVRIVVAGDIFHNKLAITNESILCAHWFFSELDKICKTFVVIAPFTSPCITPTYTSAGLGVPPSASLNISISGVLKPVNDE